MLEAQCGCGFYRGGVASLTQAELDALVLGFICPENGERPDRLPALRPAAHRLWQGYRGGELNYHCPETRAVYLVRYLPMHLQAARQVLCECINQLPPEVLSGQRPLRLVSLGCGPCGDSLAAAEVLHSHGHTGARIEAVGVDQADWGDWVAHANAHLFGRPGQVPVELRFERIGQDQHPIDHPALASADLVVIQNMLPEHKDEAAWVERFIGGVLRLKAGTMLAITERGSHGYLTFVCQLAQRFRDRCDEVVPCDQQVVGVGQPRHPDVYHLFDRPWTDPHDGLEGLALTKQGRGYKMVWRVR